jgi:hypothetical protein
MINIVKISTMKENIFKGFATGMIIPVIAFYFYVNLVLHTDIEPGFIQLQKDDLLSQVIAISVLANILPLFVYNKRNENEKFKGVAMASVLYAVFVSVLYFV